MKSLFGYAVSLFLGATIALSINGLQEHKVAENNSALIAENNRLLQEIDALKNSLSDLQQSIATKSHPNLKQNPTVCPPAKPDDFAKTIIKEKESIAENFAQFQHVNSLSQYVNSINQTETALYKDLEQKFLSEEQDYNWAADYEQKLHSLIIQKNPFGDSALTSVICKTQKCQIKIAVQDAETSNNYTREIAEAIHTNELGITAVPVVSASDLSEGFVTLYISRDKSRNVFE